MDRIDFEHRTRLIYGVGSVEQLGVLSRQLGSQRALVVSDSGVVAAGHFQRAMDALVTAGVQAESFLDVHENPTSVDVQAGLETAQQARPDLLIGIGGGSAMDCTKGINFLYSCGGRMEDYWGVDKATGPMLPMIAVPTTSGTGSEAQSFALISQANSGKKMACGDRRAACKIAVLDPELTLTQPARVTALTGIDAISHALETYVSKRRNPLSACYSREAWQLLVHGFPKVFEQPNDLEARGEMQLGAYFAGLAIETSMLGAAHALANPLTTRFGITHGQAVGMMLPNVIRFNGPQVDQWYSDLWYDAARTQLGQQCAADCSTAGSKPHVEWLAELVHRLVELAGLETELLNLGVSEESLDALATEATHQWTGSFNPRALSQADYRELYQQTMVRRVAI